jgi:hypothetical protein
MKPSIRISIAYVLGSLISKTIHNFIMADSEKQYLKISATITADSIDVEEPETGNRYYGMYQGVQGTYHHANENSSITFKIDGTKFSGTDSQSGKSFNGTVINNAIKLFDYDEGKYLMYHLM